MKKASHILLINRQKGSLILLTLILISLLASFSLISLQSTIESTKLTRSFVDNNIAFQRAEIGMLHAEKMINESGSALISNKKAVSWKAVDQQKKWFDDRYAHIKKESNQPIYAYVIEHLSTLDSKVINEDKLSQTHKSETTINTTNNVRYYLVTINGISNNRSSQVILQNIIKVSSKVVRVSWLQIR